MPVILLETASSAVSFTVDFACCGATGYSYYIEKITEVNGQKYYGVGMPVKQGTLRLPVIEKSSSVNRNMGLFVFDPSY